jgi:hypothetical protein
MLDYYCVVGEKVRMGFVCLLTVPDYTCNCVIAADEALNYTLLSRHGRAWRWLCAARPAESLQKKGAAARHILPGYYSSGGEPHGSAPSYVK